MINVSLFLRIQKYNYVLHILYKLSCQKYALIVLWYVFKMIQYLRQIELRVLLSDFQPKIAQVVI